MNAMQQALEALEMFSQCDAFAIPFKPLTKEQQRQDDERVEEVYEAVEKAISALKQALAEPETDDPALTYCHRFAILMECVMLGGVDKHWNEMGMLLDEYHSAQHKWRETHGEPYVSGFGKD